jgi:hypothetical protein
MRAFGTERRPSYSFVGTWFSTGCAGTAPRFGWKSSKLLPQLRLERKPVDYGTRALPLAVKTVLITVRICDVDKADHRCR